MNDSSAGDPVDPPYLELVPPLRDDVPVGPQEDSPEPHRGSVIVGPATPRGRRARLPRSRARVVFYAAGLVLLAFIAYLWSHKLEASKPTPAGAVAPAGFQGGASPASGTASPATGAIIDTPFAQMACGGSNVTPSGFQLMAAFQSTAGAAAAWEDHLAQGAYTSPLDAIDSSTTVAVCFVDGPWTPPAQVQQAYQQLGLTADRGIVIVTLASPNHPSTVIQGPIAPHSSLPIQRPVAPGGGSAPSPAAS